MLKNYSTGEGLIAADTDDPYPIGMIEIYEEEISNLNCEIDELKERIETLTNENKSLKKFLGLD